MNYTELKSLIQDYTENDETTFVSHLDDFIRQTEERLTHLMRMPYFKKNSTGTATASSRYLSTPSDFLSPFSLAVQVSGSYQFLLPKNVDFIREAYPDPSVEGLPKYYALWDEDTFVLAPTPDQGYTMELYYFAQPASIVTANTSWFGDNMESALLYGCLVEAYTYMKGEQDLVQLYDAKFKEAVTRFKDLGEARTTKDIYRSGELSREPS